MRRELAEVVWKDVNNTDNILHTYITVPLDPQIRETRSTSDSVLPAPPPRRTNNKRKENNNELPEEKRMQYCKRRCHFVNCKITSNDNNVFWRRIQPPVSIKPNRHYDDKARKRLSVKKKDREMSLRRIGCSKHDPRFDVRICNRHATTTETVLVKFYKTNGKLKKFKEKMELPCADIVISNELFAKTRGNRTNRAINRAFENNLQELKDGDIDALQRLLLLFSYSQESSPTPTQPKPIGVIRKNKEIKKKVAVRLDRLTDNRVKIHTGFPSLLNLLSFIAVICDGDVDKMTKTCTTLTWFEEWYLYFEVVYGKSIRRWVDATDKYNAADCRLRLIFDTKMEQVLRTRMAWPRYVTMAEDCTYRQQDKWEAYDGKRVIMFDNTNIIIRVPSNADAQRNTYSLYYAGNVGKGAVFIQPCGWMGSHEVWTGGVSDTLYMQKGKVFDMLNHFIDKYEKNEEVRNVRYTIILDKGYRIVVDAFNEGGHFTLQPIFAEYDRHFTTWETLHTSSVASDRSGNERAVRYLKISDYVSKGLICNESVDRVCNTWLAWGYQVNFMYKPVH
jgi:hypothetical protein